MYHREYPVTPTQEATNGALDIFVEGCRKNDVPQQLLGLSVLRSATEAQVRTAMPFAEASGHVTLGDIETLLQR